MRDCHAVTVAILCFCLAGCDQTQSISLVTEDFRFVPDLVRATAASPLALSIFNAGRETHEFDSPLLLYASRSSAGRPQVSTGITLPPGQTVHIVVAPPAGTYLYICRRKGHASMTGTLIVE